MTKAKTVDEIVLEYGINIISAQDQKHYNLAWKLKMWIMQYLEAFLRKDMIEIKDYIRYHKYISDLTG